MPSAANATFAYDDAEQEIRERLAARAKIIGVLPLARELDVPRAGLASFLIGRARRGTRFHVCARARAANEKGDSAAE